MPGLGARVRPTGGKTWVLLEEIGGRSQRISLGPVSTMAVAEARRACHERRARPEPTKPARAKRAVPLLREFVEGEWKEAHFHRYKPATRRDMLYTLEGRILPTFGSRPLNRIFSGTGEELVRRRQRNRARRREQGGSNSSANS